MQHKMREGKVTSQTTLRAESPHLEVANCHLIFITEHIVKAKERRRYKQLSRLDVNELPGEKAHTYSLLQSKDI